MAWVARLNSGDATVADADALRRWCNMSAEHRRAFAEAKLLWEVLGPAAENVRTSVAMQAANRRPVAPVRLGRRALIGGALAAASIATVGYLGSKPPLKLWPTLDELRADYRTATGERKQLALADDVSLVLNTQTSIGLRASSAEAQIIELVSGEAAISAKAAERRFDVVAGNGLTTAAAARFDLRRDDATVRVTCLEGNVGVTCRDRSVTLPPGHQVAYDNRGLQEVAAVDIAVVTAWQNGQLIFRHEPLARVVEEVNRYRPGRIVLMNAKLGTRDVVATFHLNRLDEVVAHLTRAFDMRARFLPGDVVVLS